MSIPDKLYKYRAFGVNSLRMLTEAELYIPQPKSFNDPLDCAPTIEFDISRFDLERVLYRLVRRMSTKDVAEEIISYNRHMSSEYGDYKTVPEADENLKWSVSYQIENELKRQFGEKGVLTFSQTWNSVLMWSHYGDEHRGLCIEYETTGQPHPNLKAVEYGATRAIKASDLLSWLVKGDEAAYERVIGAYFYAKARDWKYEKEWREIYDSSGVKDVEYRVSAIYFGMRCDRSVVSSIVKLLSDEADLKLYQIRAHRDKFKLLKELVDCDEVTALAIREPSFLMFARFDADKSAAVDVSDVVEGSD